MWLTKLKLVVTPWYYFLFSFLASFLAIFLSSFFARMLVVMVMVFSGMFLGAVLGAVLLTTVFVGVHFVFLAIVIIFFVRTHLFSRLNHLMRMLVETGFHWTSESLRLKKLSNMMTMIIIKLFLQ